MGESEWQHASWVSALGKWAWIIVIVSDIIGILYSFGSIAIYGIWALLTGSTWNILASIIGIIIALLVIRPKFSNPCGEKDWDTLYGWTLSLGGLKIPWMFLWGLILLLFGWYGWGALAVLIPAFMLIFMGPKEYNWSEEKAPK